MKRISTGKALELMAKIHAERYTLNVIDQREPYKDLATELGMSYPEARFPLIRLVRALDAVDSYFSGGERTGHWNCFYVGRTDEPGPGMMRRSRIVTDPLPSELDDPDDTSEMDPPPVETEPAD